MSDQIWCICLNCEKIEKRDPEDVTEFLHDHWGHKVVECGYTDEGPLFAYVVGQKEPAEK